jgi:hypothetical protein
MKKGIIVGLLIIIASCGVGFADSVDMSQMDAIFEEFDEFSSSERAKYYEMMEGAMDSEESIEGLAKNLSFLLSDDQKLKIAKKGYSLSEVQSNIRKLKTWSRDDRMKLVEAFRSEDHETLNDLNRVNAKGSLEGPLDVAEESTIILTEAQTIAFEHGLRYLAIQTLAEIPKFDDLQDHWSKDEVIELASLGIVNGKRKGAYYPDDYISRIEILAILTRISVYDDSKLPEGNILCDESLWYYNPLKRASRLGLTDLELGDDLMALATREEVVAYMMRAYAAFEFETIESSDLQTFKDADQIKLENREAFKQAVALGFVHGWEGELKPADPITRAEAAVMSNRFYRKILWMQGIGGPDETNW